MNPKQSKERVSSRRPKSRYLDETIKRLDPTETIMQQIPGIRPNYVLLYHLTTRKRLRLCKRCMWALKFRVLDIIQKCWSRLSPNLGCRRGLFRERTVSTNSRQYWINPLPRSPAFGRNKAKRCKPIQGGVAMNSKKRK